jgi:ATP-dependent Clp protease ATP-binding subunit ClpA
MSSAEPSQVALTVSARHVIDVALLRAVDRGILRYIDQETFPTLVVWSILRWERKVGLEALARLGTDLDLMAGDVDELLKAQRESLRIEAAKPSGGTPCVQATGRTIDTSALFDPLLRAAYAEATLLGHAYVGTEHLLLAAIALADRRLSDLLIRHRVNLIDVRNQVTDLLRL